MNVIENMTQFLAFLKSYVIEEKVIILPVFSDHQLHPLENNLSLLYVRFFSGDRYVLVFDHSEGLSLDYKCIEAFKEYDTKILTFDKKILSHVFRFYDDIIDMHILSYLSEKMPLELTCATPTHHYIYNHLSPRSNLNRLVPLVKHYEMCDKIVDNLLDVDVPMSTDFFFYNNTVIPVFAEIEKAGLKTPDKYLFSEYNFYTATGRPSNRFGGINFAALNKSDGSRKKFISRFENGALLQFDFSAYHLRVIGRLIHFDLPSESMHTYLGRQYFDKEDLTEEEYDESKKISFKFLYGKIPDDIAEAIPYFGAVKKYVDKLWDEINMIGWIESHISGRRIYKHKIDNINPEKLWNYLIQLIETEKNCLIMKKVQDFLTEYETILILYTYDSFLFDINMNDGKKFFIQLKNIIEQNGKFPTTVKIGSNYNDMKKIIFPYL